MRDAPTQLGKKTAGAAAFTLGTTRRYGGIGAFTFPGTAQFLLRCLLRRERRSLGGLNRDAVTAGLELSQYADPRGSVAVAAEKLRPDAIYDAIALSRRPGNDIFEFVRRYYIQGSFWLRRDSPHIHWDRIPRGRDPPQPWTSEEVRGLHG